MRFAFYGCLLLALLRAGAGYGQAPLRRVYTLDKPDGSVLLVAENHHSMPFTVLLCAELRQMQSSRPLPFRFNVLPGEQAYVLAVFTPTGPAPTYRYTTQFQDGIYTGRAPDTSYVYRLPYQLANDTLRPRQMRPRPGKSFHCSSFHLYGWRLPANTPIVAARAGTVVAVKQSTRNSHVINANLVYVLHQDGSFGCYENIGRHTVIGQPGRQVAVGDTLAYFTGNTRSPLFWFDVQQATDSLATSQPVVFRIGQQLVRPK